ncbi:MAG: penicillin-binding protein activator, partial [Magnetococcus sp. WYHC-3]
SAAQEAARRQLPIITLNPHEDVLEANPRPQPGAAAELPVVFVNAFMPRQQARMMAEHAFLEQRDRPRSHAAVLAPDTPFGELIARAFLQRWMELGGKAGRIVLFPEDNPDFSGWIKALTHVDAATLKDRQSRSRRSTPLSPADPAPGAGEDTFKPWVDFDVLFVPASAAQVRLIAPQAAFWDIQASGVTLLGIPQWIRPELLTAGTDYLKGAVFCDTDPVAQQRFNATFQKLWSVAPGPLALLAFDSVAALAQSLRDQRQTGLPWHQRLVQDTGFLGAAGRFRFTADGASERHFQIFTVAESGIVPYRAHYRPAPGIDMLH